MTDSSVGPMTDLSAEELLAAAVTIRKRLERPSGCSLLPEVFWRAPSVTTVADQAGSREEP